LALLQAFLNSFYDLVVDPGADLLGSPDRLQAWLSDRGLSSSSDRLTRSDVARAITVREGLRDVIASPGEVDAARLNDAFRGASIELRLTGGGPSLTPTGARPLDRALGTLLAIAITAMLDGSWSRLKSCPGHHCGWVFYDRSRNNSGRWCSMTVCGGREKSRAHYHRHRAGGG
jgi:predicted RNA-binding Zn ribbon-like protein